MSKYTAPATLKNVAIPTNIDPELSRYLSDFAREVKMAIETGGFATSNAVTGSSGSEDFVKKSDTGVQTTAGVLATGSTEESTSTITGALRSAGGAGIAGNIYTGGGLNAGALSTGTFFRQTAIPTVERNLSFSVPNNVQFYVRVPFRCTVVTSGLPNAALLQLLLGSAGDKIQAFPQGSFSTPIIFMPGTYKFINCSSITIKLYAFYSAENVPLEDLVTVI